MLAKWGGVQLNLDAPPLTRESSANHTSTHHFAAKKERYCNKTKENKKRVGVANRFVFVLFFGFSWEFFYSCRRLEEFTSDR